MSTQSDIAVIRAIMTKLDANRTSKFSYTDNAFNNDIIDGVAAFNASAEQNVPLEGYTAFNDTVRAKGIRTQGASLPRMGMNHFFGRVSYNLNKLVQKLSLWMDIDIAARAHNAAEYDESAPYKTGDVCYATETKDGIKTFTYYTRVSTTPTTITGIPVTNISHWAEVISKRSGVRHKYAIADLTTGYSTSTWYPVVTTLQAFNALTDNSKDPALQVRIEAFCNGAVSGFANAQRAEFAALSKFTGFGASSTDIVLSNSVTDQVSGADNTASNLAPIGYTKLPLGRQAVVWLKGGSKYMLWNSFGAAFTLYTSTYNNSLDSAIAPATTLPLSVTNGTVRADVVGKLCGVAPGNAGLTVLGLSSLSTINPAANGVAAPGTSGIPSRQDHVHPSDTSKANLASPTFTGTPAAPTPAVGTNSTQIATAAMVTAAVTAEATARSNADALKANLASPTFTGTPAAPTPAVGTNSTQIATAAMVTAAALAASRPPIGYVYFQGPNDSDPATLYSGTTWSDVSWEEANCGRRVAGALAGSRFAGVPARLSVAVTSGVPSISIASGGSGYLSSGSGTVALAIVGACTAQMFAIANVTSGVITGITVTAAGSGYTSGKVAVYDGVAGHGDLTQRHFHSQGSISNRSSSGFNDATSFLQGAGTPNGVINIGQASQSSDETTGTARVGAETSGAWVTVTKWRRTA